MTSTQDLIERLAADAGPVRVLRPPLARAAIWLAGAGAIVVFLVLYHGARSDLAVKLGDAVFVAQILAASATGVLAAVAAFHLSLPDRSRAWMLLPAPALAAWLSVIGYGCLTNWVQLGPDALMAAGILRCLGTVVLVSAPLLLTLPVMLRHAGVFRGVPTSLCGALAVASVAAVGVSVLHDIDATILVLMLNGGVVAVLLALGAIAGPRALSLANENLRPRGRPYMGGTVR